MWQGSVVNLFQLENLLTCDAEEAKIDAKKAKIKVSFFFFFPINSMRILFPDKSIA